MSAVPPPWENTALYTIETPRGPVSLWKVAISGTYSGLFDGRPTKHLNEQFIAWSVQEARMGEENGPVQVICEAKEGQASRHPVLPPVTTILWLDGPPVPGRPGEWRALSVVWLHHERGLGPPASLERVVDRLDWEQYGRNAVV